MTIFWIAIELWLGLNAWLLLEKLVTSLRDTFRPDRAMNPDQSFFNIVCRFRTGLGLGTDELLSRSDLVKWIVTGQFHDIVRIFEHNPAEGWSRDVTDDVMSEANAIREAMGRDVLEVA